MTLRARGMPRVPGYRWRAVAAWVCALGAMPIAPAVGQGVGARIGAGVSLFDVRESGATRGGQTSSVAALLAAGVSHGAVVGRGEVRYLGAYTTGMVAAGVALGVQPPGSGGALRPYVMGAVGRGWLIESDRGTLLGVIVGVRAGSLFLEGRVDRFAAAPPHRGDRVRDYASVVAGVRFGR